MEIKELYEAIVVLSNRIKSEETTYTLTISQAISNMVMSMAQLSSLDITVARNPILSRSVEDLILTVRSMNCLKNADIKTVGELVNKTERELLRVKNFGYKSLAEVREELSRVGLEFKKI